MGIHLTIPFTIDSWTQVGETLSADDAPEMAIALFTKTYLSPALSGSATGHILTTQGAHGASYVAQERITCILEGRNGSFVLEHHASTSDGAQDLKGGRIVGGSGTGELKGVWGHCEVEHELLKLDVEFAPRDQ